MHAPDTHSARLVTHRSTVDCFHLWMKKLELLRKEFAICSHTDLARKLGMSKHGLCNVRSRHQELSVETKLRILRLLGRAITLDDYVSLLPPKTRAEVGSLVPSIFDPVSGWELTQDFWRDAIEAAKVRFRLRSDYALANCLSISPTEFSLQKSGQGRLSSVAKIKILSVLGRTAGPTLLIDLLPPRAAKRSSLFQDLKFDHWSRETSLWSEIIDRLIGRLGISYSALARELSISPQKLADARKGRQELSCVAKTKLLCLLQDPISPDVYVSIFPRATRQEIADAVMRRYDPDSSVTVGSDFWIDCLNLVKSEIVRSEIQNGSTSNHREISDTALADHIGITNITISKLRNDIAPPSSSAKLKILEAAGLPLSGDVLIDLLPRKANSVARCYGGHPYEIVIVLPYGDFLLASTTAS